MIEALARHGCPYGHGVQALLPAPVRPYIVEADDIVRLSSGRHHVLLCSRFVPVSGEKRFRSTVGMSQFKFSWGEVWGGPMNRKKIRADEAGDALQGTDEAIEAETAKQDAKTARLEAARERARKQEIARRFEEIKIRRRCGN